MTLAIAKKAIKLLDGLDKPSPSSSAFVGPLLPPSPPSSSDLPTATEAGTAVDMDDAPQPAPPTGIEATPHARATPKESLPAFVLASDESTFNILFDLVDSTAADECDDIWRLLNRLPTAPYLLQQWLHMGGTTTVSQLLFRLSTVPTTQVNGEGTHTNASSMSITRLSYNIQIINILLQTSQPFKSLQPQLEARAGVYGLTSASSSLSEALSWWYTNFIKRQGITSILEALQYVLNYIDQSKSDTGSLSTTGITVNILLQAIQLLTSLLCPFLLASTHSHHPGVLLAHYRRIAHSRSDKMALKLDAEGEEGTPSIDFTVDPVVRESEELLVVNEKLGWLSEPSLLFSEVLSVAVQTGGNGNGSGISNEEQWKQCLTETSHIVAEEVKPVEAQKLALLYIASIKGLTQRILPTPSNKNTDKSRAIESTVTSLLNDFVLIWSCCLVLQPNIVFDLALDPATGPANASNQVPSAADSVLDYIINPTTKNVSLYSWLECTLFGLVASGGADLTFLEGWLVDSLLSVIIMMKEYQLVATAELSGRGYVSSRDVSSMDASMYYYLRHQLLLVLLKLRPKAPVVASSPSTQSFQSFFALASALANERYPCFNLTGTGAVVRAEEGKGTIYVSGKGSVFSDSFDDTHKVAVILELYNDLLQAYISLQCEYNRGNAVSALPVEYMEGTLKLFSALLGQNYDLLIHDDQSKIVCFILVACLGIDHPSVHITLSDYFISPPSSSTFPSVAQLPTLGVSGSDTVLSSKSKPILCTTDNQKKYAYNILKLLSSHNISLLQSIYTHITRVQSYVEPPVTWLYRPEKESISGSGKVGLKNLGCTCYMNSLLQVLYMQTSFREQILHTPTIIHNNEKDQKNDYLLQLQLLFLNLNLSEKKCYTPTAWIYANKDETGSQPIDVSQQQDAQEYLQLFCERLEHSLYIASSSSFSSSIAHTNNTTTTGATSPLNGNSSKDILKRCFGGKLVNLLINDDTASVAIDSSGGEMSSSGNSSGGGGGGGGGGSQIREREESFVCLSLDVKGCQVLYTI